MTKFKKIKSPANRKTKGVQAMNEHMLLQNSGSDNSEKKEIF